MIRLKVRTFRIEEKEKLQMKNTDWNGRILVWLKSYRLPVLLILSGLVIGVLAAFAEAVFYYGLVWCVGWRQGMGNLAFLLMPLICLLIVWMFQKFGGPCCRGMNLVFEVHQGKSADIPKKNLILAMVGTWLSHLAGASVGREGVALQLGATVSNWVEKIFPKMAHKKTVFLVTGMAAGFAGLFGTPFTATFFALEIFKAGSVQMMAILPAMTAAFIASNTAGLLGIHKEVIPIDMAAVMGGGITWWQVILLGVVFGIAGGLFAWSIHKAKHGFSHLFPNPFIRVAVMGSVLALMMALTHGRYSNLGGALVEAAAEGGEIFWWDWILKFILSVLSLSIGFMGGEVMPLFTIGATLGCVFAPLIGVNPALGAALGYAAVFGAGTNTMIAPILIGMEIFGWSTFPVMFVVCMIGYLFNRNMSIYELQELTETEGA